MKKKPIVKEAVRLKTEQPIYLLEWRCSGCGKSIFYRSDKQNFMEFVPGIHVNSLTESSQFYRCGEYKPYAVWSLVYTCGGLGGSTKHPRPTDTRRG